MIVYPNKKLQIPRKSRLYTDFKSTLGNNHQYTLLLKVEHISGLKNLFVPFIIGSNKPI